MYDRNAMESANAPANVRAAPSNRTYVELGSPFPRVGCELSNITVRPNTNINTVAVSWESRPMSYPNHIN